MAEAEAILHGPVVLAKRPEPTSAQRELERIVGSQCQYKAADRSERWISVSVRNLGDRVVPGMGAQTPDRWNRVWRGRVDAGSAEMIGGLGDAAYFSKVGMGAQVPPELVVLKADREVSVRVVLGESSFQSDKDKGPEKKAAILIAQKALSHM
jgi:hypothetical protein